MTQEEFYGAALAKLRSAEQQLTALVQRCPVTRAGSTEPQAILYCKSRIKSPESMLRKLALHQLPGNCHAALTHMHDAVGIRIICAFVDDVYHVAEWLAQQPTIHVLSTKDYISYPKPNGYRSLHLIVESTHAQLWGLTAEIQLRTIAIDFWASLEHQIKYKHEVRHEKLIRAELKRCADEIASADLSMQTIRELLSSRF